MIPGMVSSSVTPGSDNFSETMRSESCIGLCVSSSSSSSSSSCVSSCSTRYPLPVEISESREGLREVRGSIWRSTFCPASAEKLLIISWISGVPGISALNIGGDSEGEREDKDLKVGVGAASGVGRRLGARLRFMNSSFAWPGADSNEGSTPVSCGSSVTSRTSGS